MNLSLWSCWSPFLISKHCGRTPVCFVPQVNQFNHHLSATPSCWEAVDFSYARAQFDLLMIKVLDFVFNYMLRPPARLHVTGHTSITSARDVKVLLWKWTYLFVSAMQKFPVFYHRRWADYPCQWNQSNKNLTRPPSSDLKVLNEIWASGTFYKCRSL